MIAYHASGSIFSKFEKSKIGKNFFESEGSGFFFTKSKSWATKFGRSIAESSNQEHPFIYEVKLKFKNPIKDKVDSDFIQPADKYDLNCGNYTHDAFVEKNDSIYIEGTKGEDLIVVFEPDQIEILRIFENNIEVYNKNNPEITKYPELNNQNSELDLNHQSFHDDGMSDSKLSYEFGNLLDSNANKALREVGFYSYEDGRNFFLGNKLKDLAFSLICDQGNDSNELISHRENCVISHDFDSGVTMVQDLTGSNEKLATLSTRPLKQGGRILKSFVSQDDPGEGRELMLAVGPEVELNKIKEKTPEYELNFVVFSEIKTSANLSLSQENKGDNLSNTPTSNKFRL